MSIKSIKVIFTIILILLWGLSFIYDFSKDLSYAEWRLKGVVLLVLSLLMGLLFIILSNKKK